MVAIYSVWSHASKKYISRGSLNHFDLDTMKRFADDLADEDNTTFSVEQFEMQMPDAPGKIVYTTKKADAVDQLQYSNYVEQKMAGELD